MSYTSAATETYIKKLEEENARLKEDIGSIIRTLNRMVPGTTLKGFDRALSTWTIIKMTE